MYKLQMIRPQRTAMVTSRSRHRGHGVVRASQWTQFLIDQSYIIGKGMTLFVLFTASMNWWYYRRTREDFEKKNKK